MFLQVVVVCLGTGHRRQRRPVGELPRRSERRSGSSQLKLFPGLPVRLQASGHNPAAHIPVTELHQGPTAAHVIDRLGFIDGAECQQDCTLAIGIEPLRILNSRVHFRLGRVYELEPIRACDAFEGIDCAEGAACARLFGNLQCPCIENPGRCVTAHPLLPVRRTVEWAQDMEVCFAVGRFSYPYGVVVCSFCFIVAIQRDEAVNERIENRHLPEVEQAIEIAAQIQSALQYQAGVFVLTGREIRRSQPVQWPQQGAIGPCAAILNDLDAAQKNGFGRFVVMQPILCGGEVGERVDQCAVSAPVLLFGHGDQLFG